MLAGEYGHVGYGTKSGNNLFAPHYQATKWLHNEYMVPKVKGYPVFTCSGSQLLKPQDP